MKKILLFLLFAVTQTLAQDIINIYAPWQGYISSYPDAPSNTITPDYENITASSQPFYYWNSVDASGPTLQYNGEYQIYLGNFFWSSHIGSTDPYSASYSIETVSFPFMPDPNCAFSTNGCTSSTSTDRYFYLPDDNALDNNGSSSPNYYEE